jgi:hypothetical protein
MADDELHHKIRLFCARTRMVDFFRPFDKLNLKRIPPETAVRAIDSSGLSLSKAEHDALAKLYVDEHGLFDYAQLVNDHNDVPPAGFYERNPAATAAGPVSRASSFSASPLEGGSAGLFVPLTDTERALLADVLERVRHYVATRGIILKNGLRDYDEHKKGLVTASRFSRELASVLPILRPAEAELVAKAYMTADRADVRYMVFHADATPAEEERPTGARGVMGSAAPAGAPLSPDRLKLNLGASAGGFGATGGSLGGSVGRGAGAAAGASATVSAPLTNTRQKPAPEKVLEYRTIPAGDIEAIEASIVRQTFERRLRLWDCFCDWDKKRLGEMPRALFRRGVAQAEFEGLSPACVETLADKYAVATDPTQQTIRWMDFVDEVRLQVPAVAAQEAFVQCSRQERPQRPGWRRACVVGRVQL